MVLTPDEQHLFEQLGRNPVFKGYLEKRSAERINVLKKNTNLEQLCQAQGAVAELEHLLGLCERAKKT